MMFLEGCPRPLAGRGQGRPRACARAARCTDRCAGAAAGLATSGGALGISHAPRPRCKVILSHNWLHTHAHTHTHRSEHHHQL